MKQFQGVFLKTELVKIQGLSMTAKVIVQWFMYLYSLTSYDPETTLETIIEHFGISESEASAALTELLEKDFLVTYRGKRYTVNHRMVYEWVLNKGFLQSVFPESMKVKIG